MHRRFQFPFIPLSGAEYQYIEGIDEIQSGDASPHSKVNQCIKT
jgi:hypothetical protein